MSRALDGIGVLDCSRGLAGRFATLQLADLGAEVTEVRWADGPGREPAGCAEAAAALSTHLSRGKRAIEASPAAPESIAALRGEALAVDVVVEDGGDATMGAHGLGYEELAAANEGLVYCSLRAGGGIVSPAAPGHELMMQALGGLMSITGSPEGGPRRSGPALVDALGGIFAATGILIAIQARPAAGRGQRLEVDLLAVALAGLVNQGSGYTIAAKVPGLLGNDHPSVAPYGPHRAAGEELIIAVGNDRQFQVLCEVLGAPELATDARFATMAARNDNREELRSCLERQLADRGAGEWATALLAKRVPAGVVNDLAQAYAFAEEVGLAPLADTKGPDRTAVRSVRSPIRLSDAPATGGPAGRPDEERR
ncbi:MAG: CoA transferase [Solirubrobacterales bacterium]